MTAAQLLGLAIGWSMLIGEGGAPVRVGGILLAGVAVCVIALLMLRSSREALALR